jgi:hypothetical protein
VLSYFHNFFSDDPVLIISTRLPTINFFFLYFQQIPFLCVAFFRAAAGGGIVAGGRRWCRGDNLNNSPFRKIFLVDVGSLVVVVEVVVIFFHFSYFCLIMMIDDVVRSIHHRPRLERTKQKKNKSGLVF